MAGLSPLKAAFLEAALVDALFTGAGAFEVQTEIEPVSEAAHVAVIAAAVAGIATYRAKRNSFNP